MHGGRWSASLPGVLRLAAELDVSPHTVRRALRPVEAFESAILDEPATYGIPTVQARLR
ncbi:MAG: GntR family transcriptional regulator [Akkermansiaceae bacterium]|nr:GntR family transcriptional regulator [Akkermansiaceae bacterium]